MPLGEQLALDPLEPADHLVHEPAHLGELAGDGDHLAAHPLADGLADLVGQRGLELGRRLGQPLDLVAGALERRFDVARLGAPLGCGLEPLARPLERVFVHGGQR